MSEADVETAYQLYANFEDVVDRVKVVTLEEIKEKGYTLSVNNYIEKTIIDPVPTKEIRRQFYEALDAVYVAENNLRKLLVEGGYIDE